jgi:hypothetical protein
MRRLKRRPVLAIDRWMPCEASHFSQLGYDLRLLSFPKRTSAFDTSFNRGGIGLLYHTGSMGAPPQISRMSL